MITRLKSFYLRKSVGLTVVALTVHAIVVQAASPQDVRTAVLERLECSTLRVAYVSIGLSG